MFKRFDLDGTGVIDDSELRQGLESFGFNFDQEQAGQVLTVFDPKGDGTVDKKEFMKFCENTDVSKAVQHTLEVKAKALESKKLKDDELQVHILESMLIYPNPNPAWLYQQEVCVNIHAEINKLAASMSPDGEQNFQAMFDSMDEDAGGHLATDEFLRGLRKLGRVFQFEICFWYVPCSFFKLSSHDYYS